MKLKLIIRAFTVSLVLNFSYLHVLSQSTGIPLQNQAYEYLNRVLIKAGSFQSSHFGFQPVPSETAVEFIQGLDTIDGQFTSRDRQNNFYILKSNHLWSERSRVESRRPLLKHIYRLKSDFLFIDRKDLKLRVNPVIDFSWLYEFNDPRSEVLFVNTRGLELEGQIDEKLGFYAFLSENQARLPQFLHDRISRDLAIPGEGRYVGFKSNAYDFFKTRAHISFNPLPSINIQFGHGKHFIGDGIRSVIWSDNSADHLFLKFQTKVWKLQYTNLFAQLTGNFTTLADGLRPRKYAALHHLSINFTSWLNIGIFESIIFKRDDGYDLNYLNPLIFYRAMEAGLGSPDNVALGLDFRALVAKKFKFYGQFYLDEFSFEALKGGNGDWRNKFALQLGVDYIDVFGLNHLDSRFEANLARPFTYGHSKEQNTYTHYNQALAHPLGANFYELIAQLIYQPRYDVRLASNLSYAKKGLDSEERNFGGNVFRSFDDQIALTGNTLAAGESLQILRAEFVLSWQWKHNLNFDFSYTYRKSKNDLAAFEKSTNYFALTTRLNIERRRWWF